MYSTTDIFCILTVHKNANEHTIYCNAKKSKMSLSNNMLLFRIIIYIP